MGRRVGAAPPLLPGPSFALADAAASGHANARSDAFTNGHAHGFTQPDADPLVARHSPRRGFVKRSMTSLRAALPLLRAVVLAGLAIALIMFGLPALLGFAAVAAP